MCSLSRGDFCYSSKLIEQMYNTFQERTHPQFLGSTTICICAFSELELASTFTERLDRVPSPFLRSCSNLSTYFVFSIDLTHDLTR
jgi:hypothetical protein